MKRISILAAICAPLVILASCSAQSDVKFPDFSAEGQETAIKIQAKFIADCTKLVDQNADDPEAVWHVSPEKEDAFCECTTTKVVSQIPEDLLEKALNDVKRARGIPMLPMTVFARFGDDAKATVESCK